MIHRVLILGGSTEAREFAGAVAGRDDLDVTLSLAGRTANPAPQPVPVVIGGFGGVDGLVRYLSETATTILVDATHPFAVNMSANAAAAAAITGIAHFAIRRPPWQPVSGDRWQEVESVAEAIAAVGAATQQVFVALGRQDLAALAGAPFHHYVIRSVDPIDPPEGVPQFENICARGPFDEAEETALLRRHRISKIVAKNSGGQATYAKLAAARTLSIDVLLIARPALPEVRSVADVAGATALLAHLLGSGTDRGE